MNPKVASFLFLLGSIFLAYEVGQWVLGEGLRGFVVRLGMLIGIAVALAILVRWRWGILLFLSWLTLEDLIRKYSSGAMTVYFVKDAMLAVIYAAFFIAVARRQEKMFRPKFWVPLVALFFVALAQVFNPRSPSVFYGLMGMEIDFYFIPLLFLGYALIRNRDDLDRFLSFNLKLAIAVALVGIIQGLGWKSFLNPVNLAPQFIALGHLVRTAPGLSHALSAPPSVFVSQGRYGNYLSLMFTLAVGVVAYKIFLRRKAYLAYAALGLLAVAIFLAGSKGAVVYALLTLVGMGTGLLWGAKGQPWISARLGKILRRSLVALAAALLLFVFLYPNLAGAWWTYYYEMLWPESSTSMLASRTGSYPLDQFEKATEYAGWQWGYGTGTASLGGQYITGLLKAPPPEAGAVENGFGDMLIEWGIAGLALWLLMAISLVVVCWRLTKRLPATPFYPLALAITWFSFWVLLPFTWGSVTTYQNYIVNAYIWLLVGVLCRLPELAASRNSPAFASPGAVQRRADPLPLGRVG
jgi:hypothetical protein